MSRLDAQRSQEIVALTQNVYKKATRVRLAQANAANAIAEAAVAAGREDARTIEAREKRQREIEQKTLKMAEKKRAGLNLLNTNPSYVIMYRADYYLADLDLINFRTTEGNNLLFLVLSTKDPLTFGLIKHLFDLENIQDTNGQTVLDVIKTLKSTNPALYQQFKQAYDAEFISGKFKNLSKDVRALAAGLFGNGAATAATVERTDTTPTATV